jgi:hemerythrin-like domain-containing protein
MNDPMAILKADHREVKANLKKLAESDEGPERDALCREVTEALTLHMQIEEQLVYPLILSNIGEEEEEEATIEHGLAREGVATMGSMTSKPGFGAAVEMLAGGINHHVEEEETELLPELKSAMDRKEWMALGDRIVEAKQAAGAPVPGPSKRRSSKRGSKASSNSR